ncbi:phosphohydrolase [Thermus sp.]|uniref:phosphohydrolase n=1 Tax=Thermus sp. TaxID=275 RepID=UPI00262D14F2|nr:phosphohydrolase [Thermus sp.]MCX7848795.1 phosphohydrolase [Thermus sp.]MDW8016687.1 phosphohydrolase [Thermus sp.]
MRKGFASRLGKRLARLFRAFRGEVPEDAFALAFLKGEERALYLAMDPRDRAHAVRVAKRLLRAHPQAPSFAVRAALLHDAGKALRPYRPWERILTGLYAPPVPPYPLRRGLWGAFQIRRHHPLYAAERIQDPEVRALVLEHHRPQSLWGKRLHRADQEE